MNRSAAIVLAIATFLPVGYMFYFFAAFGQMDDQMTPEEFQVKFELLFRLHLSTMALMVGLLIIYIVYLFRTEHVPKDKKALWAVVLFMGNIIAMPVFWFLYVWKPLQRGGVNK
ncbi:hypothetical protein [Limnobacter sp. 130]|uniref:hypothetical protein n=1 Tax=Limnobacter sp. 130 TaxID=2653147 RepID=UPI00135B8ED9|nr:hypothetical protein [Limnobacter sp. 130]